MRVVEHLPGGEHRLLARFEHCIHAPDDEHWQDHVGILAAPEKVAQDIVGNAARVGAHFQARLADFAQRFSFVGDVRGQGLMSGIEMVSDKAARTPMARSSDIPQRVARQAYQRGAMVRISGPNMILSPPLIITREEVDVLVDALDGALAEVEASL